MLARSVTAALPYALGHAYRMPNYRMQEFDACGSRRAAALRAALYPFDEASCAEMRREQRWETRRTSDWKEIMKFLTETAKDWRAWPPAECH